MWWLPAAGAALKGITGYASGLKQRERSDALMGKLQNLANYTPSEREYVKRQREIAEGGDPFQNQMMQEQMNRVVGNIRQTGAENMQRTEGSIIRQGMESSIVAAELRRKTADTTLRNVAEQSRRIAAENRVTQERTKREAEEKALRMQMGVDDRMRSANMQVAQMKANRPSRTEMNWNILGNLAGAGVQAYGDFKAHSPWTGMSSDLLTNMSNDDAQAFWEGLTSEQQARFIKYKQGL